MSPVLLKVVSLMCPSPMKADRSIWPALIVRVASASDCTWREGKPPELTLVPLIATYGELTVSEVPAAGLLTLPKVWNCAIFAPKRLGVLKTMELLVASDIGPEKTIPPLVS